MNLYACKEGAALRPWRREAPFCKGPAPRPPAFLTPHYKGQLPEFLGPLTFPSRDRIHFFTLIKSKLTQIPRASTLSYQDAEHLITLIKGKLTAKRGQGQLCLRELQKTFLTGVSLLDVKKRGAAKRPFPIRPFCGPLMFRLETDLCTNNKHLEGVVSIGSRYGFVDIHPRRGDSRRGDVSGRRP